MHYTLLFWLFCGIGSDLLASGYHGLGRALDENNPPLAMAVAPMADWRKHEFMIK